MLATNSYVADKFDFISLDFYNKLPLKEFFVNFLFSNETNYDSTNFILSSL